MQVPVPVYSTLYYVYFSTYISGGVPNIVHWKNQ